MKFIQKSKKRRWWPRALLVLLAIPLSPFVGMGLVAVFLLANCWAWVAFAPCGLADMAYNLLTGVEVGEDGPIMKFYKWTLDDNRLGFFVP